MAEFFAMDGYGLYIWVSYVLTFAFVLGAALHSWPPHAAAVRPFPLTKKALSGRFCSTGPPVAASAPCPSADGTLSVRPRSGRLIAALSSG